MLRPIQLRMARAALRWGVQELAEKAGISAKTVTRIEQGAEARESTCDALRRTLEAAGIEFIDGERPGVCMRSPAADRAIPIDELNAYNDQ